MRKLLPWLCLVLFPFASRAQLPPAFQLERIIGTPLFAPSDIAVDTQGYMYVLEDEPYYSSKRGVVTKLSPQGQYVGRIDISKANYARPYNCDGSALAMDAAGNLYIADTGAGEVRKFSPAGLLLRTFTDTRWHSCFLFNPKNLTVDAAGNLYVVDGIRVQKFNAQGVAQWEYAPVQTLPVNSPTRPIDVAVNAAGQAFVLNASAAIVPLGAAGQPLPALSVVQAGAYYLTISNSASLVIDAMGSFYVGRPGGSPVFKFSAAGVYQAAIGPDITGGSLGLTLDAQGKLYACASGNRGFGALIYKFEPTGPEISRWGSIQRAQFIAQNSNEESYTYNWTTQQIIKRTPDGRELLRFGGPGYGSGQFYPNIGGSSIGFAGLTVDNQGNVYTIENSLSSGPRLKKFDGQGRYLSSVSNATVLTQGTQIAGIAVDPGGNIYVSNIDKYRVYKLSPQGQVLLTLRTAGPGSRGGFEYHALATDDLGFVYVADSATSRVRKFTPTGQLLRQTILPSRGYFNSNTPVGMSVDQQGSLFLSHPEWDSIRIFDRSGRFQRRMPNQFGFVAALSVNRAGNRLLTLRYDSDLICVYASSAATTPPGRISGRIFHDANQDCQYQSTEAGLSGVVVVAEPGSYYGLSDENGEYHIAADTGTYTVRQMLPHDAGRLMQQGCTPGATVRVPGHGTSVQGPEFGNQVSTTSYLSVSVASRRRRRCFRSTTTVDYANTGFAPAANAQVTVQMPEHVLFISADVPHSRDARGNYVFAVGTLQPNQRGFITIQDSVACGNPAIRGLTVCTTAWITPANTYPVPPGWNRASVAVAGTRQPGNVVRFTITNTGTQATTDSLQLRVFQDTDLALVHRYALAAADSLVLRVPATGRVVRVEADQPTGHPLSTVASANVELPARVVGGLPSAAMAAFPPNTGEPTRATDCQPIVDSFDPNDKQVLPVGLTAQHYTPTNAPLRYRVRFQNTGTDVAYRVVVVDTLAADLDVSTLRVGAASHPYQLRIAGKARPVLSFRFDNIMLPDSGHSQLGSHGFVEFSIWPKAGLAPRASIENFADIFFDFNPPVRTNTTLNRIFDMPATVVPAAQLRADDVIVSPSITRFAPAQGRPGTLVTLTGRHFAAGVAGNQARFQGLAATVLSASPTTLTVRVPVGAATAAIRVVTADGSTQSATSFSVLQPPTLTALSADEGVPGAVITLTGTNFSALAAQDTVTIAGVAARVAQATASSLQVEVPNGATTGPIVVKTLGGQVASVQVFRTWYPPTVAAFLPGKGKAGSLIMLTGNNFAETAARNTVQFGPVAGTVVQASATQLRVRVPVAAQSGALRVQTPGGMATAANSFVFLPAPVVAAFTPADGSPGTVVTISGLDFLTDGVVDTVYIGGARAAILSSSPTRLVVEVPKPVATGVVAVAGAGGRGLSAVAFRVLALSLADAITIYPNPATAGFEVNWRKADFAVQRVQVFNSLGSLVFEQKVAFVAADSVPVVLASSRSGLYVVVVQTAVGTVTKRVTLL